MTREQARHCLSHSISVEDRHDEDFKTGLVVEVVNDSYCIVHWDDADGTLEICTLRNLVVQYPERLEVA